MVTVLLSVAPAGVFPSIFSPAGAFLTLTNAIYNGIMRVEMTVIRALHSAVGSHLRRNHCGRENHTAKERVPAHQDAGRNVTCRSVKQREKKR
jgi:hypothetical protein